MAPPRWCRIFLWVLRPAKKFNLTYVFISHDLAVIRHISDKVAVMYLGQIVESGTADAVLGNPAHPYTQMLMAAVLEPGVKHPAMEVTGEPPNTESPPQGCSLHPRCPHMMGICREHAPDVKIIGTPEQQHTTQCWLYAAVSVGLAEQFAEDEAAKALQSHTGERPKSG